MPEENLQDNEMNGSLKRYKENAEREHEREQKRQETINRLKTDPAIQQYLQQFCKYSTDSFIETYAFKLEQALAHSDLYEGIYEKENTRYLERAENCLAEIQLKKLYDLRRLWGANALHIEGVQSSFDFYAMGHDVMNCKLLPTITQEEFDLYFRYAKSTHFEYSEFKHCWLGLENTLHGYGEEEPGWFAFNNLYSGNKVYSELEDMRYKKERVYYDLGALVAREELEAKYESGELQKPVHDKRPMINVYGYDDVFDFMNLFEEPEVVRKFEAMCNYGNFSLSKNEGLYGEDNTDWLDEQVESIMLTLGTMKDFKLRVEANNDWRIALIRAWDKYEKEETIKALPVAYENYLFRLENKIAMPVYGGDSTLSFAESFKNQIFKGRKRNGEPEDFNF